MTGVVLVHHDDYADWVFDSHHPTQGRRFIRARERLLDLAGAAGIEVIEVASDHLPDRGVLELVHDPAYVDEVIVGGRSGEWAGERPDLGRIAHRMVGGTLLAAEALMEGRALTAVHFAGAKHHAMRDHSSGFCVFADFAITAHHLLDDPRSGIDRIAILDFDAHHGDGTEALLIDEPRALTFSIHDRTIFPGTGLGDSPDHQAYNEPLAAGSGDEELAAGVERFIGLAREFEPDMVLIAMGADGHDEDPLSSLRYSIAGMESTVSQVRLGFPDMPILLGGAGGYLPDSVTPEAWVRMTLAASVRDGPRNCATR
jgi:acetoin utilization protein AcuC